jgi:hypothetical protein
MQGSTFYGQFHILQVPGAVFARFETCLAARNIPENTHVFHLTSALAPIIRLSYRRMVYQALPSTVTTRRSTILEEKSKWRLSVLDPTASIFPLIGTLRVQERNKRRFCLFPDPIKSFSPLKPAMFIMYLKFNYN